MVSEATLPSAAPVSEAVPAAVEPSIVESSPATLPSSESSVTGDGVNEKESQPQPATIDLDTLSGDQLKAVWQKAKQHPELQREIETEVQSRKDREIRRDLDRERQRWEGQRLAAAQAEQERLRLEHEATGDPYELGNEVQRRAQEQKQLDALWQKYGPSIEQTAQQRFLLRQAQEVGAELDDEPFWTKATQVQRDEWINQTTSPVQLLKRVKEMAKKADKAAVEAELARFKVAAGKDQRAEERAGESSPDIAGGTPAASDREFAAAYAEGRSRDHTRAKKMMADLGFKL